MFSTFLKEVKDVFNKWALISAFYPSLIFWTFAVVFVLSRTYEWDRAQAKVIEWEKKPLVILACLVWISFWSFLTINLQPALVRLFEGNWPLGRLAEFRRNFWRKRWQKMKEKDKELEKGLVTLYSERTALEQVHQEMKQISEEGDVDGQRVDAFLQEVKEWLDLPSNTDLVEKLHRHVSQAWAYWDAILSHPDVLDQEDPSWRNRSRLLMETVGRLLATLERESEAFVRKAKSRLSTLQETEDPKELKTFAKQARELWLSIQPYIKSPLNGSNRIASRSEALASIMNELYKLFKPFSNELEERRLDHNRIFLLYYPPESDDVMPTRLGNVLKGADKRVYNRYRLDPAIMWSRLQPQLIKEFGESLQSAKGPFDLMITLSSFSVLFGVLLSAFESVHMRKPWLILLLVIIPFLSVKAVSRTVLVLLAVTVIWTFAEPLYIPIPRLPKSVLELRTLAMLVSGTALLSWLTYENAVQACVVYCEKVQTAFDLYRWKILEEMHLQLPPNFEEERELWKDLCDLVYRSQNPRPPYFRYVVQDQKTKQPVRPLTRILAPKKTLPPYYLITTDDLKEIEIPESQVPIDAVRNQQEFLGKTSLRTLTCETPVPRSSLVEAQTLEATVAISLQIEAAHAVDMSVGIRGDLTIVPPASPAATEPNQPASRHPDPLIIEDILVLDIRHTPDITKLMLTVAIPLARKADYVNNLNGVFLVTRRLGGYNADL